MSQVNVENDINVDLAVAKEQQAKADHVANLVTKIPDGWDVYAQPEGDTLVLENIKLQHMHVFQNYRKIGLREINKRIKAFKPVEPESAIDPPSDLPYADEVPLMVSSGGQLSPAGFQSIMNGDIEPRLRQVRVTMGTMGNKSVQYQQMNAWIIVRRYETELKQLAVSNEIRDLLKLLVEK